MTTWGQNKPLIKRILIESKPGAIIRVERIELTEAGRACLTVRGGNPVVCWLLRRLAWVREAAVRAWGRVRG